VGDVTEQEMRALTMLERSLIEGMPYLLKLVDLSRVGAISAGARKAGAEKVHEVPVLAVAIYGMSFPVRVIAELVAKAGNWIRRIKDTPTRFFAREEEARAFLDSQRAKLSQSRVSSFPEPFRPR